MSSSESDVDYESADEGETTNVKVFSSIEDGNISLCETQLSTDQKENEKLLETSTFQKKSIEEESNVKSETTSNSKESNKIDVKSSKPDTPTHQEQKQSSNDIAKEKTVTVCEKRIEEVLVINKECESLPQTVLPKEEVSEDDCKQILTEGTKSTSVSEVKQLAEEAGSQYVSNTETRVSKLESAWVAESKEKDIVKRTVSDSEAGNRVMLFKERKALEKTAKASSLNEKDVLDRLSDAAGKDEKKTSPGWGLGNWSASFISTAASSVSTFTSQVSQGIGTVLETVEASLGVPTPEDLVANKNNSQTNQASTDGKSTGNSDSSGDLSKQDSGEKMTPVDQDNQKGPVGSIFGGVSAFTKVFESTSSKMITGSLDTLELIGRKTMDILTEGDPGLRKKRSIFSSGSSTLSQVLREARLKAEENAADSDEQLFHYSKLFDEFQGLVHLEALEMLSERCKSNVQKQLLESENESLPSVLDHLKEICEDLPAPDDTPDDDVTQDFECLLDEHCRSLPFKTKVEKIKSVQCSAAAWLINCKEDQDKGEVKDPIEVYQRAISSLSELTATIMEHYHKVAELALVTSIPGVSVEECASNLTGMTTVFCKEVAILSSNFCQCLSTAADDSEDPDLVNPLITNVYLECSNSNAYIQDAFQLLIPVLQDLAIRHSDV